MKRLVVFNASSGRMASAVTRHRLHEHLHQWGQVVTPTSWLEARTRVREFLKSGGEQVVVLGGDGTLNSVVNGFWDEKGRPLNPQAALTVTRLGTGCDYFRTVASHFGNSDWWSWIDSPGRVAVDVGLIEFSSSLNDGAVSQQESRYFINVGSVGFNARVARLKGDNPKWLPHQLAYAWPTVREMVHREPVAGKIAGGGQTWEGELLAATLALGRYAGGGMKFGRHEFPDRGQFDVRIIPEVGIKELVRHLPKLYQGGIEAVPQVRAFFASDLTITTARPLEVEFDGEVIGTTPVTFRVLPKALHLTGPQYLKK